MNIVRRDPGGDGPDVWRWLRDKLPASMKCESGYGYSSKYFWISASGNEIADVRHGFWAGFGKETIELKHPQYYQDVVNAIEEYERATGKAIQFIYWAAK